jgi:hypothetical protein
MGLYPLFKICHWNPFCGNGWGSGDIANIIHDEFFLNFNKKQIDKYKFNKWVMWDFQRVSINCMCYFGKDILECKESSMLYQDDEHLFSHHYPLILNRPNEIIGTKIVCHHAYYTQRGYVDKDYIISNYEKISRDISPQFENTVERFLSRLPKDRESFIVEGEDIVYDIGVSNEKPSIFPDDKKKQLGFGLNIWQYPCQLKPFIDFIIKNYDVENYVEFGLFRGGNFIFASECLFKYGKLKSAIGFDLEMIDV